MEKNSHDLSRNDARVEAAECSTCCLELKVPGIYFYPSPRTSQEVNIWVLLYSASPNQLV